MASASVDPFLPSLQILYDKLADNADIPFESEAEMEELSIKKYKAQKLSPEETALLLKIEKILKSKLIAFFSYQLEKLLSDVKLTARVPGLDTPERRASLEKKIIAFDKSKSFFSSSMVAIFEQILKIFQTEVKNRSHVASSRVEGAFITQAHKKKASVAKPSIYSIQAFFSPKVPSAAISPFMKIQQKRLFTYFQISQVHLEQIWSTAAAIYNALFENKILLNDVYENYPKVNPSDREDLIKKKIRIFVFAKKFFFLQQDPLKRVFLMAYNIRFFNHIEIEYFTLFQRILRINI